MLIKLTPEQLARNWDTIRPGVRESLPPQISVSDEAIKNVLKNLLYGNGTFWVYTDQEKIYGFVITTPHMDPLTETGSLLIYAAYSFGGVTEEMLIDAVRTLQEHAKGIGMDEIITYTGNKNLIRLLERFGAKSNYRLISIPA